MTSLYRYQRSEEARRGSDTDAKLERETGITRSTKVGTVERNACTRTFKLRGDQELIDGCCYDVGLCAPTDRLLNLLSYVLIPRIKSHAPMIGSAIPIGRPPMPVSSSADCGMRRLATKAIMHNREASRPQVAKIRGM
jgi:hypothetical protein